MLATAKKLPRPSAPSVPELVVPPPRSSESIEPPPDSGVRESVGRISTQADAVEARPLTYSTYTVAQLDSRSVEAQKSAPPKAPAAPRWPEVKLALVTGTQAFLAWRKEPFPRRPIAEVEEVTALRVVGKAVARAIPWRRIAIAAGGVAACIAVLFFAVITVAEMTDDLKPGKHVTEHAVAAPPAPPEVKAPPPAAPVAVVVAPADEEPAPPPPPKKKRKASKRPASGGERFVP